MRCCPPPGGPAWSGRAWACCAPASTCTTCPWWASWRWGTPCAARCKSAARWPCWPRRWRSARPPWPSWWRWGRLPPTLPGTPTGISAGPTSPTCLCRAWPPAGSRTSTSARARCWRRRWPCWGWPWPACAGARRGPWRLCAATGCGWSAARSSWRWTPWPPWATPSRWAAKRSVPCPSRSCSWMYGRCFPPARGWPGWPGCCWPCAPAGPSCAALARARRPPPWRSARWCRAGACARNLASGLPSTMTMRPTRTRPA